jgi:hypothetical protein
MSPAARHVLQEALLWGAAALGGFVLIYFFDDLKAAFGPGGSASVVAERIETKPASSGFAGEVRLKADARGHFKFPGEVNGRAADFMADTGATLVVLTYEDARLGLSRQRPCCAGNARPRSRRGHHYSQRPGRSRREGRTRHQPARNELLEPAQGLPDAWQRVDPHLIELRVGSRAASLAVGSRTEIA